MKTIFETSYARSQALEGKRKVVLFIHSSDDGYGSDMVLLQVLQELDRHQFYPIVLLPDDTAHIGLLSPHLRGLDIEYHYAPLAIMRRHYFSWRHIHRFAWKLLWGNLLLLKTILRRKVEIIYCNTLAVSPCAPAVALSLRPVIWHVHELLELGRAMRTLIHFIVGATSTRILTISTAVRSHLLRDISWATSKTALIRNSIDTSRTPSISRTKTRELMGIGQTAVVVGMLGRISEWKGQRLLVRAMALLRDRGVVASLVIVGGVFDNQKKHLDDLEQEIRANDLGKEVYLTGYVEEPTDILSTFDLFVLPSLNPEPFGLVILEAMNCGIPTIASAHGGPIEVIRDGVTGFLVPPNNEVALANAIESLILDPELRVNMGMAAREEIRTNYNLHSFGARMRTIFTGMLPSG